MRKLSSGLFIAIAACGTANYITQTQAGGVIRLQGDPGKANEEAQKLMAAQCGSGNYLVTQKGEEPIGNDTYNTQQPPTEVRIHYTCGAAGTPPPPPTAPQPPPAPPS